MASARIIQTLVVLLLAGSTIGYFDWSKMYEGEHCVPPMTLVVSFGGVGTTGTIMALKKLGVHVNHEGDKDELKHKPFPLEKSQVESTFECEMEKKIAGIIYVYADPVHAVFSLYRRGYQGDQTRKLRGSQNASFDIGNDPLEYAAKGEDALGFEQHWDCYVKAACANPKIPFLFLHSDTVRKHAPQVTSFVGVPWDDEQPSNVTQNAIDFKPDWELYYETYGGKAGVDDAISKLNNIYSSLRAKLNAFGDIQAIRGNCTSLKDYYPGPTS